MGIYINRGCNGFREARNGEYVDKSGLIAAMNNVLFTEQRFMCVSRSRRFGKTMAAKMLAAYYDKSCDSRELFEDLAIAKEPSFEKHLNKYAVISFDMGGLVVRSRNGEVMTNLKRELREDLLAAYPHVEVKDTDDLLGILIRIVEATGERFICIIDEWDAVCREYPSESPVMTEYVDWLRRMFKDFHAGDVFAGVYMTGILPLKKYKTQSALNNFTEYSMVSPGRLAGFFGFTKDEVMRLANKYNMDFDEFEKWYDGYQIGKEPSMFNPNSVIQAIHADECGNYWATTGAFETVSDYIQMNFGGLKDDVLKMLAGGRCAVDPTGFQNDLSIINSKDDVLTVLIHLGYLSYDKKEGECYIPNRETAVEMANAVKAVQWKGVTEALQQSKQLLQDTLNGDARAVAKGVEAVHDENTSILSYNNENSLACVVSLAYYFAKNDYIVHREYPTGKGFADIVMIPRKGVNTPAIIVELKYGETAETGISQIKKRNYPAKVADYADNLLLVGISYDKRNKQHSCQIEKA